jgi:hypothetical protein
MMDKEIILKIDNQEIPMNPFVKRIFMNVINGLVGSLDKIPENAEKIELLIKK